MSPNAMATTKKAAKSKADSKGGAPAAGAKIDPKDAAKRKLGLRGAAPWAARHAAKHAAEARARAAEPPLPGSARATIRTPTGADDIKAKIADLHNSVVQIKGLRKNLNKGFFDIGKVLRDIQARRLYEAKGFGTFEAFLEREIDLGKTTSLRLVKTAQIFQKEAALEYGMDRVFNAIAALETPPEEFLSGKLPPTPLSAPSLPMKPPGR
ncbi:MAG: hypothetical protein ACLQBL_39950 [Polyangiaceae bacterium]|jgi:hypothetical protein